MYNFNFFNFFIIMISVLLHDNVISVKTYYIML